jgi:hypothetical protein
MTYPDLQGEHYLDRHILLFIFIRPTTKISGPSQRAWMEGQRLSKAPLNRLVGRISELT